MIVPPILPPAVAGGDGLAASARLRPRCAWVPLVLALLAFSGAVRAGAVPMGQLAGWWRLDGANGRAVADRSPHGHDLLLEDQAVINDSGGVPSLRCDGLETAARIDGQAALVSGQRMTLAVWARAERHTREEPLFLRPHPNPGYSTPIVGLYLSESCPTFGMFHDQGKLLLHGPRIALHQWLLIAVTLDGEQARLWVDGRQVAAAPQSRALPVATESPWYVGRGQARYFRGNIGEVMVWSRALGEADMAALYQVTSARYAPFNPPGPLDPWSDRTVVIESPGNQDNGPWRPRPTRTIEGLVGYEPAAPPKTDRYGGSTAVPPLAATGFFRIEKNNGRAWLITPEGHRYWNAALNHVAPEGGGPVDKAAFAQQATEDLRALGFNGIGTLSLPELRKVGAPLPYFLRLNFAARFAREQGQTYATAGHAGFTGECIPVFHPDFAPSVERYAGDLRALADDPFAVGIFTDNELQVSVDLLDRHLRLDPNHPFLRHGREAALAWLKARNRPVDPALLSLRDRYEFIAHVFGTYSRIVHDAIRKQDRNHLIFGSRFFVQTGQFENPAFWAAVGPWIDVIAINYYGQWGVNVTELEEWSATAKRPFLISEWYSKGTDAPGLANTGGAGWLVRTQADRGAYYQHFALSALECRALVGIHYFKYMDDPSASKALDAVGGANKGFFAIDGQPWRPLTGRAREVNTAIYPLIDFFDARRGSRPSLSGPTPR